MVQHKHREHRFSLHLKIPVTIFLDRFLEGDERMSLEFYLSEVLNNTNKVGGRLCFNGELVRHALRQYIKGLASILEVDRDNAVYLDSLRECGDKIAVSLDYLGAFDEKGTLPML